MENKVVCFHVHVHVLVLKRDRRQIPLKMMWPLGGKVKLLLSLFLWYRTTVVLRASYTLSVQAWFKQRPTDKKCTLFAEKSNLSNHTDSCLHFMNHLSALWPSYFIPIITMCGPTERCISYLPDVCVLCD